MGTVTLMVQSSAQVDGPRFVATCKFQYFWWDFPRIWDSILQMFLKYWQENRWIGTKCHESILDHWIKKNWHVNRCQFSLPFAAVVSLQTTMIDLHFSPTSTLEQCLKSQMNLHHVPHTQTGYFYDFHTFPWCLEGGGLCLRPRFLKSITKQGSICWLHTDQNSAAKTKKTPLKLIALRTRKSRGKIYPWFCPRAIQKVRRISILSPYHLSIIS